MFGQNDKLRRSLGRCLGRWAFALISGLVVSTWTAGPGAAQDNGDATQDPEFAEKFWSFLQEADYQDNWARWPGHEQEFKRGSSAHGAYVKIFVNQTVENDTDGLPTESVLIKENYNAEKELVAITPMYRVGNEFDAANNNWYWVKYKPDGSLFERNGKPISGRVDSCINCHRSAGGGDYVFSNDD
jgi:hypothetical protein